MTLKNTSKCTLLIPEVDYAKNDDETVVVT